MAKVKCKDEDAECTSELGREEHGENANMVETNIKIKFEDKLMLLKKLDMTIMMCQREKTHVHTVRTGMNMKKEILHFSHGLAQGNCLLIL